MIRSERGKEAATVSICGGEMPGGPVVQLLGGGRARAFADRPGQEKKTCWPRKGAEEGGTDHIWCPNREKGRKRFTSKEKREFYEQGGKSRPSSTSTHVQDTQLLSWVGAEGFGGRHTIPAA